MFNSLRTKLFLWYAGSLILIGIFFYVFVHILALKYGLEIVGALFVALAILGFVIIFRITSSLTTLSSKMKSVSSTNLDERITTIKGNDEIGELANSFNRVLDRLSEAFKREQQFIADVAHEMKTPLATINSLIEVSLRSPRKEDEYRETLEEVLESSNRADSTLKNVLDLAWSESPKGHSHKLKFNLSALLTELTEITEKLALKKELKVTSEIVAGVEIFGYREKLARALLNILDNAVKYSPSQGTVTIRLETEATRAVIGITDSGPGIPESDLPHIFNRFYRSSNVAHVNGTGLGLAISKAIINLHNGEIRLKSEPSKGTNFCRCYPNLNFFIKSSYFCSYTAMSYD